jgi:hydrogenase maturation factor
VNSVKSDVSQLEIRADGIQSTVTSLDEEINTVSTQVTQLADEITLKVQKRTSDGKYVVTGIGVAIGEDSQSEVAILADRFRILGDVEGESQPVFAVDTQTQKIYILGDLIAEGLIRATEVQAEVAKALLMQAELGVFDEIHGLRIRADKITVGGWMMG